MTTSDETFETAKLAIQNIGEQLFTPQKIPSHILPTKNTKFLKHINPADENASTYKINRGNYKVDLKSKAYIEKIVFHTANPKKLSNSIKVFATYEIEGKKTCEIITHDSMCSVQINGIISNLELETSYMWQGTPRATITKINIYGYTIFQLDKLTENLQTWLTNRANISNWVIGEKTKIDQERQKLSAKQDEATSNLNTINQEIQQAEDEYKEADLKLSDILSEIITNEETLKKLKSDQEQAKTSTDDLESKAERINDTIQKKNIELKSLNENIVTTDKKLKALIANKNLFTDEIEEYAARGNRNIWFYSFFAIIPLLILSFVTSRLYLNSESMLHLINDETKYSIMDILLSRLPYVLVSIFLIQGSYYLCKAFVVRIMEIHRDRLNLSRVTIIAKDISEASSHDLEGLSDEQKYEIRNLLKMEMLKAHLSKDVGEDYKYKSEANFDKAISNPLQRAIEYFRNKNTKESENTSNPEE